MSYTSDGLERFGRYTKPETVGDVLRRARESYGLELESVSESLKIKPAYLQAIEDSRFDDLPGAAYAAGFVRSYADYLGLDSIDLIRRFRDEALGAAPPAELLIPAPQRERRFPGGAFLVLSVVLAGVAYGAWYMMSERDKVVVESVPAVPAGMLAETEATAPRPAADATVAVAATVGGMSERGAADQSSAAAASAPDAQTPGSPEVAPAEAPAATAPAETAPTQVAATSPAPPTPPAPDPAAAPGGFVPPGQVFGADNEGARIIILARLESWVRVSDENQKPIWTRVLREGESYQVPNDPRLTLTTGNAGGLEIYVDGKPVPAIGGVGMVSRNVPLDPTAFSGGAPVPATATQ